MSEFINTPSKTRAWGSHKDKALSRRSYGGGGGTSSIDMSKMKKALSITNMRQGKSVGINGFPLSSLSNPTVAMEAIKKGKVEVANYIDVAYNLNLIENKEDYSPKQAFASIEQAVQGRFEEPDHYKILNEIANEVETMELKKVGKKQRNHHSKPDIQKLKDSLAKNKNLPLMEVVGQSGELAMQPTTPPGYTGSGTGPGNEFGDPDNDRHEVPEKGQGKPGNPKSEIEEIGGDEESQNSPHQAIKRVEALKEELAKAEKVAREAKLIVRIKGKHLPEECAVKLHAILDEFEQKENKLDESNDNINNREALFVDNEFTDDSISYDEIDEFLSNKKLESGEFS